VAARRTSTKPLYQRLEDEFTADDLLMPVLSLSPRENRGSSPLGSAKREDDLRCALREIIFYRLRLLRSDPALARIGKPPATSFLLAKLTIDGSHFTDPTEPMRCALFATAAALLQWSYAPIGTELPSGRHWAQHVVARFERAAAVEGNYLFLETFRRV
jgi:hypothetical protein